MKIFLAIKFHEDLSNKILIEEISENIEKDGVQMIIMARDYEKWGAVKLSSEELMKITFEKICESGLLLMELSEKGVGLGVEAGYAYAKGIPIVVIAKDGSDMPSTIPGIVRKVIFYKNTAELQTKLKSYIF